MDILLPDFKSATQMKPDIRH